MSERVRPTKLKFKGDKPKKKRKHDADGADDAEGSSRRRRKRDGSADEDDETWVLPETPLEIRGPVFLFHAADPAPLCVNFDATRGRVTLVSLDRDANAERDVLEKVPTDVSQVWVATRVAGADTINLRSGTASAAGSGEAKFLSCDTHGIVSAFREARGAEEAWTPIVLPDGMIAFQNVYEKYLGVDEVAGGTLTLRGDSEEVGFNERFWVKVQSKYKREAGEEERKKREGEKKLKIDEAGTKYAWYLSDF